MYSPIKTNEQYIMEEKTTVKEMYEAPVIDVVEVNPEGNILTVSNPPQWDNEDM